MGGLLVSLSAYAIYSLILGGIDGLAPLPSEYFPPAFGDRPPPPGTENFADKQLEKAYGPGCEELRRPYKIWLPEKGIAFAAGQFDIEKREGPGQKGGRVRLAPFS